MEEGLIFADGFDDCIIGILNIDDVPRVVYDKYAMVNVMRIEDTDLSYDDAVDFLSYNVWGAYLGEATPIYMYTFDGNGEQKKTEAIDFYYDCLE
jgi:hypothetical protein